MNLDDDNAPVGTDDRGSLEDRALPDLLHSICGRQQTGVLHLIRHAIIKSIYIDRGRIVFASSTDRDDRLGELLLRRGLLRVQELDNALACLSGQKRLGTILVEMGYLKPEALVQAIVDQVREIAFSLFLWTDGDYRFEVGDLPTREVITLQLGTQEVILEGIHRIDRWWRVLPALGSLEAVFRVRVRHAEVLKQVRLTQGQARIVDLLQKPTRIRDLCGLGILPDFETCQTLWAFRVIGIVEPTDEPAHKPFLPPPPDAPSGLVEGASSVDEALERAASLSGEERPMDAGEDAGASKPASAGTMAPAPPPSGKQSLEAAKKDEACTVTAEVESFNERQRRLFRLLHEKMGEQAAGLIARALKGMARQLPGLFAGVSPGPDGALDADALRANLTRSKIDSAGLAAALDLLIERELEAVAGILGPAARREIAAGLKQALV